VFDAYAMNEINPIDWEPTLNLQSTHELNEAAGTRESDTLTPNQSHLILLLPVLTSTCTN